MQRRAPDVIVGHVQPAAGVAHAFGVGGAVEADHPAVIRRQQAAAMGNAIEIVAPLAAADRLVQLRQAHRRRQGALNDRSEEHTSELQSLMRISYAVFCLKKKKEKNKKTQ